MINFDFDDDDAALAQSLRRFCDDTVVNDSSTPLVGEYWKGLAELGVLGLATTEGGGGVTTIVAAMEELGRADAAGPLVATFVATQLVDETTRSGITSGEHLVSLGFPPLLPWLPIADVVIELEGSRAHLVDVVGDVDSVDTLGGEPWGRAQLRRRSDLGDAQRAIAIGNVALAAYLVANAARLLEDAATYVVARVQFGKPLASFQAVSHPLADSYLRLIAARTLSRGAAHALDQRDNYAAGAAATARLSASKAALAAAFRCHQAYGAVGFTVEGPVGTRSARIRQLGLLPPADADLRVLALAGHGVAPSDH